MEKHSNGGQSVDEEEKLMFHDFFGTKTSALSSKPTLSPVAAAVSASSGGGLSSTSDLGSERHGVNHVDRLHLFGPRSEVSGSSMSNRLTGSKRSNSNSLFTSQESPETSHWAKMLRNGSRSPSMNLNPLASYPLRGGHIGHLLHHLSPSRFKDESAGANPSLVSQTAADEGSRTGMKGLGILSSLNIEKNSYCVMPNTSKSEPFTPLSSGGWKDLTSCTRQMTIFYGGRAHVFDDVHPNKAEVIMALAGSNGGSWSTAFPPKQKGKEMSGEEAYKWAQACEGGSSRESPFFAPELREVGGSSSCNRMFTPPGGGHQGSITMRGRDTADQVRAADPYSLTTFFIQMFLQWISGS